MSLRLNFAIIVAFVIKLSKSLQPNLQFSCDFLLTLLCLQCFWSGNLCLNSLVLDHVSMQVQPKFFAIFYTVLQTVVLSCMNFMNKKSGILNRTRRNLRRIERTFILILFQDVFADLFCNIFIFHIFKHFVKLLLNYTQLGKFGNTHQYIYLLRARGPTGFMIFFSYNTGYNAMGPTSFKIYSSKMCISEAAKCQKICKI